MTEISRSSPRLASAVDRGDAYTDDAALLELDAVGARDADLGLVYERASDGAVPTVTLSSGDSSGSSSSV